MREARKTPCGARQNRGRTAGPLRSSGIVASWSRDCGIGRSRASGIEINDHRPAEIRETEFGLPPSKYEGRFRKRRRPSLFQNVVEAAEQMGNGLFSFIPHIREAESFPPNFAVAGVDDEGMLLADEA